MKQRVLRWLSALLAIAVIAIAIGVRSAITQQQAASPMTRVIDVAQELPFRPTEARLSIDGPHRAIMASCSSRAMWELRRQLESERGGEIVERLHALGIARLLTGDAAGATKALSRGVTQAGAASTPPDVSAALWNDLAAAQFETGKRSDSTWFLAALDSAERAWRLGPTVETAWTRAAILDYLQLHTAAVEAWSRYLALERSPQWRKVARQKMKARMARRGNRNSAFVHVVRDDMPHDAIVPSTMGNSTQSWTALALTAIRGHYDYAADVILAEVSASTRRSGETAEQQTVEVLRAIARTRIRDSTPPRIFRVTYAPIHRGIDANLIDALSELERQGREIRDPLQQALFEEQARSFFLLASQVQIGRNRTAAGLWLSDRARQVALRTFASSEEWSGDVSPRNTDQLGFELAQKLPAGITFVHQDLEQDRLLTWVIRDGRIHFAATPVSATVLAAQIDQLRADLQSSDQRDQRAAVWEAQKLYSVLFGMMLTHIRGYDLLVYSPAPALRGVPLAVLHDGQRFLVERRPLAITRSIGAFAKRPSPGNGAAVLITLPLPAPGAPYLTGAIAEASRVADIYAEKAVSLRGADATPEAFLRMLPGFDIVHVGTHGQSDHRPLHNSIAFGGSQLRASDVVRMRLERAPVVVLAGCSTDDETEGRTTLSLASAFVAAGASAVVGSLWEIEDYHTVSLMTKLHRDLESGISAAEALRNAQRAAIEKNGNLTTWAAFLVQM